MPPTYDPDFPDQNGYIFDKYSKDELNKTIKKAVKDFKARKPWQDLMLRGMKCNFSWSVQSKKYIELYEKAKSR